MDNTVKGVEIDPVREKLIELLKKGGVAFPISTADHLIANGVTVPDTNVGKWIPVTERFPKHLEFILCYLVYDEICVCQWDTFNETWIANTWDYSKDAVSHWMPLPQPPKEG